MGGTSIQPRTARDGIAKPSPVRLGVASQGDGRQRGPPTAVGGSRLLGTGGAQFSSAGDFAVSAGMTSPATHRTASTIHRLGPPGRSGWGLMQ